MTSSLYVGGMSRTRDTSPVDEPKYSSGDIRQRNSYLREFIPAMVGYVVLIFAISAFVDGDTTGAELWVLLPLLPLIGAAVAIYRSVQRADEYARLLQLQAMALAFGASMLATLALALLDTVDAAPSWGPWLVFGVGMVTWGVRACTQVFR